MQTHSVYSGEAIIQWSSPSCRESPVGFVLHGAPVVTPLGQFSITNASGNLGNPGQSEGIVVQPGVGSSAWCDASVVVVSAFIVNEKAPLTCVVNGADEWALRDSNPRPHGCDATVDQFRKGPRTQQFPAFYCLGRALQVLRTLSKSCEISRKFRASEVMRGR